MDADYSIELGPMAPALEIPWQDPEGRLHYVALRSDPGMPDRVDLPSSAVQTHTPRSHDLPVHDLCPRERTDKLRADVARIPEARQFPALARFLIAVNSPPSPWQTAKCDVWPDEAEAAENLYGAAFEQTCYVDLVLAAHAVALRPSLEVHQRLAQELAQLLEANAALLATADIVVRRCYFHHGLSGSTDEAKESDAGYCLTFFLSAYGSSAVEAAGCWEHAMDFAAECVLKLQPHQGAKAQELS